MTTASVVPRDAAGWGVDDRRGLGSVFAYLVFHCWVTGYQTDAFAFDRKALAIAER